MSPNLATENEQAIERLSGQIFDRLSCQFPICTSSDEFHFFPHIPPGPEHWSRWDDFAPQSVTAVCDQLRAWRQQLATGARSARSTARQVDLRLMQRVVQTLYEQLTQIAFHRLQPTFYLTILGIGLAEAIDAGPRFFQQRLKGAPAFLEQATNNLTRVPQIFSRLGLEMTMRLQSWLQSLPGRDDRVASTVKALEKFAVHLRHHTADEAFLPPVEVYAQIVAKHIGCRMDLAHIAYELDREIEKTTQLLQDYAARIHPGHSWQAAIAQLKPPDASRPPGQHFQKAIDCLAQHCVDQGLVPAALPRQCPVKVVAIPDYMAPVRSNAAFSAAPGHPARGGTFYIADNAIGGSVPVDFRLLAAHETYPGHHLLDASRWNLGRPWRRQIEFPLFYEGWASFSEELLFETGFFNGPSDEMLMAKRRFWRALRGRVDFNIHTRRQNMTQAAELLVAHGMPPHRAQAMVQRYILKPGYQLSYTIGRRRFRRLYDQFTRANKLADFVSLVLSQGEIEFDPLETILMQGGEK